MIGFVQPLNYAMAEVNTTADRSIVRLAEHFSTASARLTPVGTGFIFLWLLSLHQRKERNNKLFT
jgi:hypothetical protein